METQVTAYYCVAEHWDAIGDVPYPDVQSFLDMCEECWGYSPELVQCGDDWFEKRTGVMVLEARPVDVSSL